MPPQRRNEEPQPKPEVLIAQAPQPKDGWQAVGKAFEGRTRPDGLSKEWC